MIDFKIAKKPVLLLIMDGIDPGQQNHTSAVYTAINSGRAQFLKEMFGKKPYSILKCGGPAVGLLPGQRGNSEVCHLKMASGEDSPVISTRIDMAINDGTFKQNEILSKAFAECKKNNGAVYPLTIVQAGESVTHADLKHYFATLDMAFNGYNIKKIFPIYSTDGRDSDPHATRDIYSKMIDNGLNNLGLSQIANSGIMAGRYLLDRNCNWARTLKLFKTIVNGDCQFRASTLKEAVALSYAQGLTDEFAEPTLFGPNFKKMEPGDLVVFIPFRRERAGQFYRACTEQDINMFNYKVSDGKVKNPINDSVYHQILDIQAKIKGVNFVPMANYYDKIKSSAAFVQNKIVNSLGEVVSKAGYKQVRGAGEQKFPHVGPWFSGDTEVLFEGEDRILVSGDEQFKMNIDEWNHCERVPELTLYEETERMLDALKQKIYSLFVWNWQNGDMLGHTGCSDAVVKGICHMSTCLQKIVPAFLENGCYVMIVSDHGNAGKMKVMKGGIEMPYTAHSKNPVPCWLFEAEGKARKYGSIPDIAPTVLKLLGLDIPKEMTASALF